MKREKCDVAIIGAGFGGLTAAGLLSKAGYNVIVAEKLPFLGGRCSTVEYKGYKFSTGAVWVMEGVIKDIWEEAGAPWELRCPEHQNYYRVHGKDYEMPEKGGLRTMVEYAARSDREVDDVMNAFRRAMAWQDPTPAITFSQWLSQYTTNPAIHGIFQSMVTMSIGIKIDEMPAQEYFDFLRAIGWLKRYGYAPEGLIRLMESLAKTIEKHGSKVLTRCKAQSILVKDRAAKGIIVERGDQTIQIDAKAVISNAGPRATIALAGKEHFDLSHVVQTDSFSRSGPQISILIASDRPLFPYEGNLFFTEARRLFCFTPVGYVCPEMAPKGKYLLDAGGFFTSSLPPYDLKKEIELTLLDIQEQLPGFDKYGHLVHVGCYHGDWPLSRSWAGYNLPSKTSVENLYDAGDGAKPAGCWGTYGAGWSAKRVVADIKKRLKPGEGS